MCNGPYHGIYRRRLLPSHVQWMQMNAFDAGESSTGAEEIEKLLKMRKEEGVETEYMRRRRAGMTAEQRRIERTRNALPSPQIPTQFNREVPSFNDPAVIRNMCEFHEGLLNLEFSCCVVCMEPSYFILICTEYQKIYMQLAIL